ncbi:MAG: alpha/beta hydrolase [Geminocystis sp.]|nr:alpha/beta hydrolase [Geminocystis sp.]HIK37476.1 alpha/beta hydrolase [Geminocystis sp. M7585_C2015_104]
MTYNSPSLFYNWLNYKCAYTCYNPDSSSSHALVLIHPIGVGLSGVFWRKFIQKLQEYSCSFPIYNPDLLGCGNSDLPRAAYDPKDWASQLNYFIKNVVKKPVILVVQGGSFPIAIYLCAGDLKCEQVEGLILSGPPAWNVITTAGNPRISKLVWNLFFDSPFGFLFYQYAKTRGFIKSFSEKQLFAIPETVDDQWISMLEQGAKNDKKRYAVFSFLAGFWRKNYEYLIKQIEKKTWILIGENATIISKNALQESPEEKLKMYTQNMKNAGGRIIRGKNVLPYESAEDFAKEVINFYQENWGKA